VRPNNRAPTRWKVWVASQPSRVKQSAQWVADADIGDAEVQSVTAYRASWMPVGGHTGTAAVWRSSTRYHRPEQEFGVVLPKWCSVRLRQIGEVSDLENLRLDVSSAKLKS